MVPQDFHEFFAAAASTAGALIGLLFVAITVSQESAEHVETRMDFHTRASAALLAFLNALVLSLAALVPSVSFGWWCVIASVGLIAFCLATARSAIDEVRRHRGNWRPFAVVGGLLVIAGFEFYAGKALISNGSDSSAIDTISYVVIADLGAGIARSWSLIRMRGTGLISSLHILARGDRRLAEDDSEGAPEGESS